MLSLSVMAAGCSKKLEESPAYQAACQGPPLRTVERRNKALEDGYNIKLEFDCIDKASFVAEAEAKARWQAANTPEASAQRKAEREKKIAEEQAQRAAEAERQAAAAAAAPAPPAFVLRLVDVNTAMEPDLATIVGPVVAAQVLAERDKRRFNDWTDLINRVIGLHAAQSAVFASVSGLNVNGESLLGAPPDAALAAAIVKRRQKN